MKKNRLQIKKSKKANSNRKTPPGSSPGVIMVSPDALKPIIKTFVYDASGYAENECKSIQEIKAQIDAAPDKMHWVDVKGFGSQEFLEQLAEVFGIHRLQMEDVVNVYQRPKLEDFQDYLFIISRVMERKDGVLRNEQLSIFLGKSYVLTIQEDYEDLLDPVRDRIRKGRGIMRSSGPGYLAYALMDTVLDNYFPILENIGDLLDQLEEELVENPSHDGLNKVLAIKRDLIVIRRAIWSEREKINEILRSHSPLFLEGSRFYIRDTYDHAIQILDIVESYKEVTASLMDVYHSSVSNKLNQVMKILTIISTIFIPLTFIVGVYGMNFSRHNPEDNSILPMNMPELYSPYGYVGVMLLMFIIIVAQLIFFFKKGWLTKS